MPVFDCSRDVVLPARPELVWEAVATPGGNAGWLFPPHDDTGGEGATVSDPPKRFTVRQAQGDWFNEVRFEIEDRGDGTSALRYTHRGVFPPEGFDAQNEAIQQHTDFYLHTLGEYLAHFPGRRASYIGDVPGGIVGPPSSATPDGFRRLQRALGLEDAASEGDSVQLRPEGLEPIDGTVDYLRENFVGIRTADALYRFFGRNAFGAPVGVSIHSFNGGDSGATKQAWQRYLNASLA
jgi:hypothetical protein